MQNSKIKFGWVFGNFRIVGEAEVTQAQLEILAAAGAVQVGQRGPASAAEKALAGYDKRPAGFRRDSIPFSETGVLTLARELARMEIAEGVFIEPEITVTEYVPSEGSEPKYKEEKGIVSRKGGDPIRLAALAEQVGYGGEDDEGNYVPAGELTVENEAFLAAIRKYIQGLKAAM